jgi:hypothetical protein
MRNPDAGLVGVLHQGNGFRIGMHHDRCQFPFAEHVYDPGVPAADVRRRPRCGLMGIRDFRQAQFLQCLEPSPAHLHRRRASETILKVADYLAAPFGSEEYLVVNFGEAGVHYTLNGTDPVLTPKGTAEKELGLSYISGPPLVDYIPGLTESVKKMQAAQIRTLKTAVSNPTAFLYSATASSKAAAINKALSSLESDILQGRKNVSEWKAGVDTWLKGGGAPAGVAPRLIGRLSAPLVRTADQDG